MRRVVGWMAAIVMGVSATLGAHHSPAVFDQTKEVKLTGVVRTFKWQNPHTFLELDVPKAKGGGVETWTVEMTSPTYLVRAGWKNNSVKTGDKVTVIVHPVREGDVKGGLFVKIMLPDGQELGEQPARLGGSSSTASATK
jgi:hypothetical protein